MTKKRPSDLLDYLACTAFRGEMDWVVNHAEHPEAPVTDDMRKRAWEWSYKSALLALYARAKALADAGVKDPWEDE